MIKYMRTEVLAHLMEEVYPNYYLNDEGHNLNHIAYVLRRSIHFAKQAMEEYPNINMELVEVIAIYHDAGHHIDRKNHEKVSAEMLRKDEQLKEFFTDDEIELMAEAVEDHRASADHEARSIYGKIVSTADRSNSVESSLERTYIYRRKNNPNISDDEIFEGSYQHLTEKYGISGYAKFYFHDEEYEQFLIDIRSLLSDKDKFIETQRKYIKEQKTKGKIKIRGEKI